MSYNGILTLVLILLFLLLTFSTLTSQLVQQFFGQRLRERYLEEEMEEWIGPTIWKGLVEKFKVGKKRLVDIATEDFLAQIILWVNRKGGQSTTQLSNIDAGNQPAAGAPPAPAVDPAYVTFKANLNKLTAQEDTTNAESKETYALAQKLATLTGHATNMEEVKAALKEWFEAFERHSIRQFPRWPQFRWVMYAIALFVCVAFNANLGRVVSYYWGNTASLNAAQAVLDTYEAQPDSTDSTRAALEPMLSVLKNENFDLPIFWPVKVEQPKETDTVRVEFTMDTVRLDAEPTPEQVWRQELRTQMLNSLSIAGVSVSPKGMDSTHLPLVVSYTLDKKKFGSFPANSAIAEKLTAQGLDALLGEWPKDSVFSLSMNFMIGDESPILANEAVKIVGYHVPQESATPLPGRKGNWPRVGVDTLVIHPQADGSATYRLNFDPTEASKAKGKMVDVSYTIVGQSGNKVSIQALVTYRPPVKIRFEYQHWTLEVLGFLVSAFFVSFGGPFWFDVWRSLSGNIKQFRSPFNRKQTNNGANG